MVIIIGAGLSGLLTGYRLQKEGIPFKILEARDRIGGRINTVTGVNLTPVELGATWFTEQHTHLIALLNELAIDYFKQHMDNSVFYQTTAASPAQIVQIPKQPSSYRISGGTSELIRTLLQKITPENIVLNQSASTIKFDENNFFVSATDHFKADQIVLAIPPKLWAKRILFTPLLPKNLLQIASQTHTWMEDAIKVALIYKHPFWQEEKIPATLFSNTGPITEFYDHCNHKRSKFALCGFIHPSFKNQTHTERKSSIINQVTTIFGTKAAEYIDYKECIWSDEEFTFEASNTTLYPHQNNGNPIFNNTFFDGKLFISNTESASEFPGYMEGAVQAADLTAQKIIRTQTC